MLRPLLCLLACTALAACTAPRTFTPVPLPPAAEPVTPLPAPAPVAPSADLGGADATAMAAACRDAAAVEFGLASGAISLSPAEETSLGFVVFGQAPSGGGTPRQFECSFAPDGSLRVVRAA